MQLDLQLSDDWAEFRLIDAQKLKRDTPAGQEPHIAIPIEDRTRTYWSLTRRDQDAASGLMWRYSTKESQAVIVPLYKLSGKQEALPLIAMRFLLNAMKTYSEPTEDRAPRGAVIRHHVLIDSKPDAIYIGLWLEAR